VLTRFVEAFIQFPKPLVAAVNGPAIGVAVTTLALCDIVYCSASATFQTPFAQLGQSPEGVSSLLFPTLMGLSKANEVLMTGKRLTAEEAERRNLVAEVIAEEIFRDEVRRRVQRLAKLPPAALIDIKRVIRDTQRNAMLQTNREEVALLQRRWVSEECLNAVMAFLANAQAKRDQKTVARSSL
jgi:peroxisomal 3,2-trans-enoyl-CoA isomerase